MINIYDIQDLIAQGFFDGNTVIAGILIYAAILIIVFAVSRKTTMTLIISLPVTLIFNMLGVLSTDIMILMIVVTVLGLAFATRDVWRS